MTIYRSPRIFGAPPNKPRVPPNGFAGQSQQTAAAQATFGLTPTLRGAPPRRRRRRRKVARTSSRRRTRSTRRTSSRKRAHLVKGSAAAKRYMAKLRRMRKRK